MQQPPTGGPQNPYGAPSPHAQTPYVQPGQQRPNQDLEMVIPVNVAPLALAAGYAGLVSVLCLPAPIALLVGILALRDLAKNPQKTGKGRAWFGIIAGGIGTLFLFLGLVGRALGLR